MSKYKKEVENIHVLIAPHHGRDSDRDYGFLDIVNPKLTLFRNAGCEHLAYDQWNSRGLEHITNNQAGTIIVNIQNEIEVYVTNEKYAKDKNSDTFWDDTLKGFYIGNVGNQE